jgi:hypothetical protein
VLHPSSILAETSSSTSFTVVLTSIKVPEMTLKYLITGATGGLGEQVLNYFVAHVPASEFAAASSNASNRARFEDRGIAFRHVNYDDQQSLDTGLLDVENLLFVSTNTFDNERRDKQHRQLVDAAKKAGVKHVRLSPHSYNSSGANILRFGIHLLRLVDSRTTPRLPCSRSTSSPRSFSESE